MVTSKNNIEDIYPLSPLQEGLLFHTLYAPGSGVYFEQLRFSFRGELELEVLEQAWQQVVDRHSILRTAFVWEGQEKPLQVVRRRVKLPWKRLDWRGMSAQQQEAGLGNYLDEDRKTGFE